MQRTRFSLGTHEDVPGLLDGGNWASGLTHLIAVEGNRWPDTVGENGSGPVHTPTGCRVQGDQGVRNMSLNVQSVHTWHMGSHGSGWRLDWQEQFD